MQMARYSVKLSHLSASSQSSVSNFTIFTPLYVSFSFPFPPFLSFISPRSSLLEAVLHSILWAPIFISLPLSSPLLSISPIQTACGSEFSPWQWAVHPQEQRQCPARAKQISLFSDLITPPASGYYATLLLHTCERRCERNMRGHAKHTLGCENTYPVSLLHAVSVYSTATEPILQSQTVLKITWQQLPST